MLQCHPQRRPPLPGPHRADFKRPFEVQRVEPGVQGVRFERFGQGFKLPVVDQFRCQVPTGIELKPSATFQL